MDCCEAHDAAADELGELALDPTLQDCCRRDLEEQAYVQHIKSELLSHDRIDTRKLLASQVLAPPPPHLRRNCAVDEESWGDGASADDPGTWQPHDAFVVSLLMKHLFLLGVHMSCTP